MGATISRVGGLLMFVMFATLLAAAPPVKSGFVITSDNIRLHYLDSGIGPAIVFVPGWTMPAEIWEPQIGYFSERYRVVALDPRSQGESSQATEGHYPQRRAQDIKEVVDQLKLAPAVLVGWSLALGEVLSYVDQFGTSTVRAVVLVDSNIGEDPNPERLVKSFGFLKPIQANRREFTEKFVRGMYKKSHPEEYYKKIIAASLKTPTNTAVVLIFNAFASSDWRPVLPKLDRPVMFAAQAGFKAQADLLKAKIPSARVELFEGTGHALFVDDPERFNKALDDFLKTNATP